jgi:hypothetical protein
MIEKMKAHAGPWYVLEHVRPFPGVTLDRIVRQIRRGLIFETSIVRGPATDYQWRFAVETPGLCRYFGRCWQCHEPVSPSDTYCQHCLAGLSLERPKSAAEPEPATPSPPTATGPEVVAAPGARSPQEAVAAAPHVSPDERARAPSASAPETRIGGTELEQLSAVVSKVELPSHEAAWDDPPRIGGIRATWIAIAMLIAVIAALFLLTQSRTPGSQSSSRAIEVPMVLAAPVAMTPDA